MLLYIPVNRSVNGGNDLVSVVDRFIPFLPVFVIPYLMGLVFWIFTIIFVNFKKPPKIALRFNYVFIAASILSVMIYIICPTYVERPLVTGNYFWSHLLSWVYANDRVYNAAPSGHTFYTILCCIELWKSIPKLRSLWLISSLLIIISTLFTKQHNIFDVLSGIVFAIGLYKVADLLFTKHDARS